MAFKASEVITRIVLVPCITLAFGMLYHGGEPAHEPGQVQYPEHLTGTFTGGFGEETCRSCHFDYDLNPEEGALTLSGLGSTVSAGASYEIRITVERPELGAAGFQLTSRYEDGRQAGHFDIEGNARVMFSTSAPDTLQYVQHSAEGSRPQGNNRQRWTITWTAPEQPEGPVIFNVAANAANGDRSEFGDYIYSGEWVIGY